MSHASAASKRCIIGMSCPSAAALVTRIIGEPARHDPAEMRQVRREVDRKAVQRHPAPDPHADRADLGLAAAADRRGPDADPARRAERGDPDVAPARRSPSLRAHGRNGARRGRACSGRARHSRSAGPARDRCSVRRARSCTTGKRGSSSSAGSALVPRGIDRRMFEQPDQFARLARGDRRGARLHRRRAPRHRGPAPARRAIRYRRAGAAHGDRDCASCGAVRKRWQAAPAMRLPERCGAGRRAGRRRSRWSRWDGLGSDGRVRRATICRRRSCRSLLAAVPADCRSSWRSRRCWRRRRWRQRIIARWCCSGVSSCCGTLAIIVALALGSRRLGAGAGDALRRSASAAAGDRRRSWCSAYRLARCSRCRWRFGMLDARGSTWRRCVRPAARRSIDAAESRCCWCSTALV